MGHLEPCENAGFGSVGLGMRAEILPSKEVPKLMLMVLIHGPYIEEHTACILENCSHPSTPFSLS